ncbi:hypothetical protein BA011_09900 [Rhizobium leguminosarum]|uniref:Uncharacterized protein n=2 Tax=Rhizobium leguminosarum TaxID=384 RepID=A0A1B1C8F1_RHILE|nr:hypothetical protein BA011_09900 [Rhizobium leguminosarum]
MSILGREMMQNSEVAIPPKDLNMLQSVLDAWCTQQRIPRKDATAEAKILINEYKRGNRSQLKLIDALINSTTH